MNGASLERICRLALDAIGRGEHLAPPVLTAVLRTYARTGRPDLFDALGAELAAAVFADGDLAPAPPDQLALAVEAAGISDDPDLRERATALVHALSGKTAHGRIGERLGCVDVRLRAASILADPDATRALESALEELERALGKAYEPGEGLLDGTFADHVSTAAALLSAFAVTERLPYPMLADELMQFGRRRWWDEAAGLFRDTQDAADLFLTNCDAVRVLCRLETLYRDEEYRRGAVMAPENDRASDVARVLAGLADESCTRGLDGAAYALALDDWLALPELGDLK